MAHDTLGKSDETNGLGNLDLGSGLIFLADGQLGLNLGPL